MIPLFEREAPLAQLAALATRSASSRGQIAVVSGEAGVGKSSLLEALQALQATRDPALPFARGHFDALFTPRQLGPFYDLAPLLGGQVAAALSEGLAPTELFPAVLAAIGALPPGSILVFEDVHWADHASLDMLKFMARRIAALRVLLVLTYRDGEAGPEHPLTQFLGDLPPTGTTRVTLEPLSRAAVHAIARTHGRDGEQLFEATAGNPFFVSEVVAQPALAGDRPPRSVRDAVLTRLSRIPAAERRFLEAISVAPDPVSEPVLRALMGTSGLAACQACEARGLEVRDPEGRFRFRHELARMATLEVLPRDEQRAYHRQLLNVYLDLGDGVPPDLIVHHAAALGNAPALLAHAPRAARRAAAVGAHKEAAAHLGVALRHADAAAPELAATLFQDWAHEAGLFEVTDAVLAARHEAVRRWRALGRLDRVGHNLRWLWRLHWYRGEIDEAEVAAQASVAVLETLAPSAELAQAYALRSHLKLLKGQRADAIDWGRRAIAMAGVSGDIDTRVQGLITVATAMLFSGDAEGCIPMDEGLQLALAHGLHEQAARAYTNYSEYATVVRDWGLAERLVLEGLAFDIKHSLDSWTGYLTGRHAQLRLDQGRLGEAETLAREALSIEGRTLLMRLPAMTSLAITRSRLGAPEAEALLHEVLAQAVAMREQQRLTPVRLGLIEHLFLRGREDEARLQLQAMLDFGIHLLRPWDAGALCVWASRLGAAVDDSVGLQPTPAQALELAGDPDGAAQVLDRLQAPFEAALCRLAGARAGSAERARSRLNAALQGFATLGCVVGAEACRRMAALQGQELARTGRRRGPYRAARSHPLGLTAKVVQVLTLLVEGASNAEIARRVSRSERTVEHHVSAVLGKLNAANRLEVILRAMAEPWITQA